MSADRPDSANGSWPSPTRLMRTLSNSNTSSSISIGIGAREDSNDGQTESQRPIDPLSQVSGEAATCRLSKAVVGEILVQHILRRTNAPHPPPTANGRPTTSSGTPQKNGRHSTDQSPAPQAQDTNASARNDAPDAAHRDLKKGVKAVSFLTRLMGSRKRADGDAAFDEETASNDGRPEGNDAELFAESVDNMGYNPQHPHPPAYIKIRSKYKKHRDFDRLFFAQELECRKKRKVEKNGASNKLRRKSSATPDNSTVWAMEFSKDGKYLAAAGTDKIVRVWAVLSSPEDRAQHEKQESVDNGANGEGAHSEHLSAPVFQSRPIREYEGHASTILDLSWSKNNFLLSSSMDKTVRLWHVSRSDCLCTFKHNDFVPSIAFHPKDDRFFLAGSLDSKLRLWSIPDKSVAYAANVPDLITAVAFTPDGKYCIAGCLGGLCMFFETEALKYQSQIHVRSTRGQNAKGSKITGLQAYVSATGNVKVLITSNDSRTRLYNFRDKSVELKFKGNENNCSQIRATLSDDARYVVCGSEDRKAYIWSLGPAEGEKRDKSPVEFFEAHNTITTVVCFAPTKTKQLLSKSEDPIYDICNPPPVTLMSRAERAQSQSSSKAPTDAGSVQGTPADTEASFEKPKESPAFSARCAHRDGNIIVTADFTGQIKVFRQDCAWSKRRVEESDRSSLFARRGGKASRTASLATKASQRSLRDGRASTSTQAPSDRILSWRQGIASSSNVADGVRPSLSKHASRDVSPGKPNGRKPRIDSRLSETIVNPKSRQPPSVARSAQPGGESNGNGNGIVDSSNSSKSGPDDNPMLHGENSVGPNMFWNTKEWAARAERIHQQQEAHGNGHKLTPIPSKEEPRERDHLAVRPPMEHGRSYVSELSDERSSTDEFDDAKEGPDDDMKCHGCGGLSFSAKQEKDGTRVVCSQCGKHA